MSLEEEVFRQYSVVVSRGGVDSDDDLTFHTEMPGGTGEGAGGRNHPSLTFQHRTRPFVLLPFLLLPSVFSSSSSSSYF